MLMRPEVTDRLTVAIECGNEPLLQEFRENPGSERFAIVRARVDPVFRGPQDLARRRSVLFRAGRYDPQRAVWQGPLQHLGLVPGGP